jgi:chorismate dehydratase
VARIRIGAVSFLNTRPLVHGLRIPHADYDLRFDTPSNLAEKLRQGEIDVGLLPIVEHLRGVGEQWVPGIGIASDGPVRTVKLYSRVPFESLTDVAVDARSRTSVAMLRILLAERYGVTPDFYSHRAELRSMLQAHQAALLIGDAAFQESDALHVWDLGRAWKELTGLPFVYAVWTLAEGVDRQRVAEWLRSSLASGLANLEEIAAAAVGEHGQDLSSILSYLRDSLHYVLGERDTQGIETFHELCLRYNLVPTASGARTPVGAHP